MLTKVRSEKVEVRRTVVGAVLALALLRDRVCAGSSAALVLSARRTTPLWDTGTFSILGYDPATGEVGGAVQSRVFSVGNGVLWADASVGVAATQAIVDVGYGPKALSCCGAGSRRTRSSSRFWDEDPDPLPEQWTKQGRQFAVMNLKGEYAAYTGPKATDVGGTQEREVSPRRRATSSRGRRS